MKKMIAVCVTIVSTVTIIFILYTALFWEPTVHVRSVSLPVDYVEIIVCRDYNDDVKVYGDVVAFSMIEPKDLEACYDD